MSLNKFKYIVVVAAVLAACTKKDRASVDSDSVVYPVKIELATAAQVSPDVRTLVDKINNKQAVSFRKITDLLIEKHGPSLQPGLQSLIPAGSPRNGRILKAGYEQKLKNKFGRDLIYNKDAVNLRNVLEDGKMQCYSGTYLYQSIRRQAGRDAFRAGKEVVIFESGHVLPGYFSSLKDGALVLIGIETTQSGGGGRVLARIDKHNKSIGERRVIDAELWALVELVQEHLSNGGDVLKWAVAYTAQKYGFEPAQPQTMHVAGGATPSTTQKLLNQSLFGFGQSHVPDGDQPRASSNDSGEAVLVGEEVIFFESRGAPEEGAVSLQAVQKNPEAYRFIFDASSGRIVFVPKYSVYSFMPDEARAQVFERTSPSEICSVRRAESMFVLECLKTKSLWVDMELEKNEKSNEAVMQISPETSKEKTRSEERPLKIRGWVVNYPLAS